MVTVVQRRVSFVVPRVYIRAAPKHGLGDALIPVLAGDDEHCISIRVSNINRYSSIEQLVHFLASSMSRVAEDVLHVHFGQTLKESS